MNTKIKNCKLYVGAVSINTIDAIIEYASENNIYLGLIPSRRQVDFDGGYIGFTTLSLKNYIQNTNIILQRDHGGTGQGKINDDGKYSLIEDSKHCDIIHIDPWKKASTFNEGLNLTLESIETCLNENYTGYFEISTEESIRKFTLNELNDLLYATQPYKISHAVIQSGTKLSQTNNIGTYNSNQLNDFLNVIDNFNKLNNTNILTKEHNGDYISSVSIKEKFKLGLSSINIAPEFGVMETDVYLHNINNNVTLFDKLFEMCYDSNTWRKWILPNKTFEESKISKHQLIRICGHYILETDDFKKEIKNELPNLDMKIKSKMKFFIRNILQ